MDKEFCLEVERRRNAEARVAELTDKARRFRREGLRGAKHLAAALLIMDAGCRLGAVEARQMMAAPDVLSEAEEYLKLFAIDLEEAA